MADDLKSPDRFLQFLFVEIPEPGAGRPGRGIQARLTREAFAQPTAERWKENG
jgi:hypothetical protein